MKRSCNKGTGSPQVTAGNHWHGIGLFTALVAVLSVGACTTTPLSAPDARPGAAAQTDQPAPSTHQETRPEAPDRADILATIDVFFEALAMRDADALESVVSPYAINVTSYPEREGAPVRYGTTSDVIASMRDGTLPKIEEPYWEPVVLQRKTLAVVWTPYEVWVDEKLSHCGVDVFNLTRQSGAWKIDSVHWTTEPSACAELWPDGRSVLRPEMFSKGM